MATTLVPVPTTEVATERQDHLGLQVALAVLAGVVLALLVTWLVLATMTLSIPI